MSTLWSWQCGPPPSMISATPQDTKIWNRRLWGMETAIAIGSVLAPGYADMLLSCILHIPADAQIDERHIRLATRALRWKHPTIAATVACPLVADLTQLNPDDVRLIYESPANEDEVSKWLDEVVQEVQSTESIDAAIEALRREQSSIRATHLKWMFQVFHLKRGDGSEQGILLQLGHTVFDGLGCFQVLDLWLHELASVIATNVPVAAMAWGQDVSSLARAVPERSKIPWSPDPSTAEHPMLEIIRDALSLHPVQFGIPVLHPNAIPTYSALLKRTISSPSAERLRSASRAHGCSVYSSLLAANFLTALRINPPNPAGFTGELCAGMMPTFTDLRGKHLLGGDAEKKDRSKWQVTSALGAHVAAARDLARFLESRDIIADVWTLARELQTQVSHQEQYLDTAVQWMTDGMGVVTATMMGAEPVVQNQRIINVSSLGVVDDVLAKSFPINSTQPVFTIRSPFFSWVGWMLLQRDMFAVMHVYTWDDELYFCWSYPEAYMGTLDEQAQASRDGKASLLEFTEKYVALVSQLAGAK